MKYLFESLDEQKRIPVSEFTWEAIKPAYDPEAAKRRWYNPAVRIPHSPGSSSVIVDEREFNNWFKEFMKRWGTQGEFVESRPGYWDIRGNDEWDESVKHMGEYIGRYYDEKGSGGYTGD